MNIFSDEAKEKTVLAFIDSIQTGKMKIISERVDKYTANFDIVQKLKTHIKYLAHQHIEDANEYYHVINLVYDCMIDLNLNSVLQGDLIDKTDVQIIEELKIQNEKLRKENQRLYSENLLFANQLRDTQNIIEHYEKPFVKKGDEDESNLMSHFETL